MMTGHEEASVLRRASVLITGALGTLGRAQAERFAALGAAVVLLDRPELEAAGAEFVKLLGGQATFVGIELHDLTGTEEQVALLASERAISVLVNNAAVIINRPFDQFSIAEYEDQMRVNSSAVFATARAVAPTMRTAGYGKIVNFCSLVLNGRWSGYVPYTASKGAVLGLTKTLARELGPGGIRVNAISPGAVVSDAEDRVFGEKLQEYNDWIIENQSLKSRIQPEHVAELVLFLSSPASDMISGQIINIDGGW
jgi:NAD(P)-dependent dehydrogenase (short-subunit alcohol dehydrogenase family)